MSKIEKIPEKVLVGVRELKRILQAIVTITRKELQNQFLTDEDYDFITEYGRTINTLLSSFESLSYKPTGEMVIADVHTDLNSRAVLEEGIGYLKVLLVAFKLPDGKISIGAGPVLRNPLVSLGESIVFVKNSYGQTIKFLERMTMIGSIFN